MNVTQNKPINTRTEARTFLYYVHLLTVVFTELHGMQTRSSDENYVRPSVCLSVKRVHCDKTEERPVQIFIPYETPFNLVFCEENWLVGRPLLCEILGQPPPVGAKSPILNRYSLVAPQP